MRWLAMWRNNFSNLISYSGTKCWKMAKKARKLWIFAPKSARKLSHLQHCDLEEEILIRFSGEMNCLRLKDTILGIWNGWAWWGGIALNLGHPNRSSSSCYIYRVFQLMMVAFLAVNRRKTLMRGRLRRRNLLYWELLIILSWESTNPVLLLLFYVCSNVRVIDFEP